MPDWLAMLKGYIDDLETRLTAARAGYLDNINNAQLLNISAARLGYIDLLADGVVGLAVIEGLVDDLETRLTAARAGYLDNLSGGAVALNTDMTTLLTRLSALRAGYLDNLSAGAVALAATALSNVQWTNALATALGNYTAVRAGYLDNLSGGAVALAASWTSALATALGSYTAIRGGYLDELAAANIPADIDELKTSKGRQLFSMDSWSVPQEEVAIPAVAATLALPNVVIGNLPAGATIVRAYAMLKFRIIENINGAANKLDGATVAATSQVVQVQDSGAGGWVDAINFVDDQFGLAASTREGGDVLIGSIDIANRVDANDTYSVRYLLAKADLLGINWNDCQAGLRIFYSV
ncbi:MAG: hypothetical protein Q8O55_01470 [Dehalococcoidales bacterium]|nr:hypothetical protein [Dehalococcoidales bacterium]